MRAAILKIEKSSDRVPAYLSFLISTIRKHVDCFNIILPADCNSKYKEIVSQKADEIWDININNQISLNSILKDQKNKHMEEVIILDDTIYGPLYPLDVMFNKMNQTNSDFWGIVATGEKMSVNDRWVSIPDPSFIVLRRTILESNYIDKLEDDKFGENEPIERVVKSLLSDGWKCSHYMKEVAEGNYDKENLYNVILSYDLIKNKCPFVHRESFERESLQIATGENAKRTLEYINDKTNYDISMIWEDLLLRNHFRDLYYSLHLEYIFPSDKMKEEKIDHEIKAAVFIHLHYFDKLDESFGYIKNIPLDIDTYITTSDLALGKIVQERIIEYKMSNCTLIYKKNRGRDISALLVACRKKILQYDYFCFVHDKKSAHKQYETEGRSFYYALWENTLKSENYILNVLDCFDKNKKLGFLGIPLPCFGSMIGFYMSGGWDKKTYNEMSNLKRSLKGNWNLSLDNSPISYGTAFWCRTKALMPLLEKEWKYEDFVDEPMPATGTISHAIERCFSYVAQDEGYYSGVVMNSDYASMRSTNLSYLFQISFRHICDEHAVFNVKQLRNYENDEKELIEFCQRYRMIYIYGAGQYGKRLLNVLLKKNIKIEGFIVTKKECNEDFYLQYPVWNVNEVLFSSDTGVLVAVSKSSQTDILHILNEKNTKNVFLI